MLLADVLEHFIGVASIEATEWTDEDSLRRLPFGAPTNIALLPLSLASGSVVSWETGRLSSCGLITTLL